jgi:hypothetical protein
MSAPVPDLAHLQAEVTSVRDQMRVASEGMARRGMASDTVDGLARLSEAMLLLMESVSRIAVVVAAGLAAQPEAEPPRHV